MSTSTPCFFGLTDVRMGTRIIAYIQLVFQSVLLLVVIHETIHGVFPSEPYSGTEKQEIDDSFQFFYQFMFLCLSNTLLNLYASYYLRKATYLHNLQYIHFWMILNSSYMITAIPIGVYVSIALRSFIFFCGCTFSITMNVYWLFVVYQFYLDESLPERLNPEI